MTYTLEPHIQTPEDLGIAMLGNPHASIIPTSNGNRVNRAECGHRIAELEGGIFTAQGYLRPMTDRRL